MNKNYKNVQNVLIYDKKENTFICTVFEKMYVFWQIVRFCTVNKKKLVRFVQFFVKMNGYTYGFFQKSFGHPVYNINK